MHRKKDKVRNSTVSKDLRWHKDDFISKIIAAVNELYLPNALVQTDMAAQEELLRSKLVDLVNDSMEMDGATETREVTIMLSDLRVLPVCLKIILPYQSWNGSIVTFRPCQR